jgi:Flp pilus assembly protein TadG
VRSLAAFLRRQRGAAVVEFAVLTPVLLSFVFGILDFGRSMNYYNDATQLANEGARFAVVNFQPPSGTLQSYIQSQGDTAEMRSNSTVCISFPSGTSNVGDPVQVTVAVNFHWLPWIKSILGGTATTTTTGKAVMRIEQSPPNYQPGCYP